VPIALSLEHERPPLPRFLVQARRHDLVVVRRDQLVTFPDPNRVEDHPPKEWALLLPRIEAHVGELRAQLDRPVRPWIEVQRRTRPLHVFGRDTIEDRHLIRPGRRVFLRGNRRHVQVLIEEQRGL
jgi:hypothetical protein